MRKVSHYNNIVNYSILDRVNPYSHYSVEDETSSEACRGQLFLGIEDVGASVGSEFRKRNKLVEGDDTNETGNEKLLFTRDLSPADILRYIDEMVDNL